MARYLLRLMALLVALALFYAPAAAQTTGRLYYIDEGSRLDRAQVEAAAQPLLARGAFVAVYAVESGKGTEFLSRLQDDGLRNGDSVNPNLIAIFVSFQDRYSEIRYGDKWVSALDAASVASSIQQSTLNPGLASGDATGAFTRTLSGLDRAIELRASPGSGAATAPESTSGGGILGWVVGLLALIGIPVGWSVFSKRRAASQALDAARKAMQDARTQAGAAVADAAQVMRDSQEKAKFDALSYAASDAASLAEQQASAEQQFVAAQEAFNAADESLAAVKTPVVENYTAGAAAFQAISAQVGELRSLLSQIDARRTELDKLNQAAPERIDSVKKALADVTDQLGTLGEDAQVEMITRPIAAMLGRAESLLAERRAGDALRAAEVASASIDELQRTASRFAAIREQISQARAAADQAAAQGYRVDAGLKALNTAEGVLGQAARALEEGGPAAAEALLSQAEAARAQGSAYGGELPALQATNAQRLAALREEHRTVAAQIAEGRRAFDLVDEFAEETWSDIRGNGSEAEAAHATAGAALDDAEAGNTIEAQEFHPAHAALDAAAERLTFARTLIDTIQQRLKDLEAARAAARDELAAARSDIDQGWAYVRSNDADVGKVPEQVLAEAAKLLIQADAAVTAERPNWLLIVRSAQQANQLADQALAQARSEVEAIAKLREQLQRAQQVAVGEHQKVNTFISLHEQDVPAESRSRAAALQNDLQLASNAAQAIAQLVEQQRAAALRDAVGQYTALQQRAEQIYQEIYAAFQRAEARRQQATTALNEARSAIARADQAARHGGGMVSGSSQGYRLLEQAQSIIARAPAVHDDADLQRVLSEANEAQSLARQAEALFNEEIERYRRQQRDSQAELAKGILIGTLLSGGGGHHGGGHSGGGGSWGGGGHSGGGGSSGGSSWGGGGSSGGSGW